MFGASWEQVCKLAIEILSDPLLALVVFVRPSPNLAWPIVLLKIVYKVLGKQLLPAPLAGTEPLILSSLLSKSSGVISLLNLCLAVLGATALGIWATMNVNSLLTATSPYVQLTVL
jgi:hypothetical protein